MRAFTTKLHLHVKCLTGFKCDYMIIILKYVENKVTATIMFSFSLR